MEDKTLVAELLDVSETVLSDFDVEDVYNGNKIYGYISHQSDHRYGALVILAVNGVRTDPQIIYTTPKLKYPFSRTGEGEDRAYKFPAFVKVNVYEKLDGCFNYHTPILLADGSKKKIGEIVNRGERPEVMSFNPETKQIIPGKITALHKYKAVSNRVKLYYEKVQNCRGNTTVECTVEHPFYTPEGWKKAGELRVGDVIYRITTQADSLMEQFLVGCLLGDAYIGQPSKTKDGIKTGAPSMLFRHSEKQRAYLEEKHRLLEKFVSGSIRGYNGGYDTPQYQFCTQCSAAFLNVFDLFWENDKKVVKPEIDKYLTPLSLAFWYMDDGSANIEGEAQRPRVTFHTHAFTVEECQLLCNILGAKYYINATVCETAKGPIIMLSADSSEIFFGLVAPHIIPSMQYKLPEKYRVLKSYVEQVVPFSGSLVLCPVKITEKRDFVPHRPTDNYVYDLTVETGHAYFAGDVLVHNTNVCCYSYADADGKRYVAFKTRLNPIMGDSKFGPFRQLWGEMLVKYPELREPPKVLSGEQSLSFELYGYRNPHLIAYTVDLETRLLFGVKQDDHSVLLPEHINLPDAVKLKAEVSCDGKENIVELYERLRADVDRHNKALDDETIEGSEGYIFYVLRADNGKWDQFKAKGETVETIHWASDFLPMSVILPTCWNALESCEDLDLEYVKKLLAEEFTAQQITKSHERIEKAINMVLRRSAWRSEVDEAYKASGLTFDNDGKGAVMRAISKHFDKKQMKDVFNALKELGHAPLG